MKFLVLLLIAGCLSAPRRGSIKGWAGETEASVVMEWGPPERVHEGTGIRIIEYTRVGKSGLEKINFIIDKSIGRVTVARVWK